jgi:hypothetical protein
MKFFFGHCTRGVWCSGGRVMLGRGKLKEFRNFVHRESHMKLLDIETKSA